METDALVRSFATTSYNEFTQVSRLSVHSNGSSVTIVSGEDPPVSSSDGVSFSKMSALPRCVPGLQKAYRRHVFERHEPRAGVLPRAT